MDKLFIPVILGTAREGRLSEKAAKLVAKQAAEFGFEAPLVDVRDYPATYTKQVTPWLPKWKETVAKADGLIIVSPEYNHAFPGELKLLLDSTYNEYGKKPAAIIGVSSGGFGGVRMASVLKITLIELQMVPLNDSVYFSRAQDLFDEQGNPKDPKVLERLTALFKEMDWYARALKQARTLG